MQIILFLIIISLLVAGGFLLSFFWAVKNGQYDDDYTPSIRLLIDDDMISNGIINKNEIDSNPTKLLNNKTNGEGRNI